MADWTYVDASYNVIYDTYIDEHEIVQIDEKQPELGEIGILVAGDTNSQFMTFEIDRYYDNIDLSDKIIKLAYLYETEGKIVINKKTKIYSDNACNICYSDDKVRFSWLLPSAAALEQGTLAVAISFIGQAPAEYELKTTIFELSIAPSINDNSSLETIAKVTWFSDIESRLYKVEQATGGADLDYTTLVNKPSINGVELDGDMTLDYISGVASDTNLGGVKAIEKTTDMTYAVGIDTDGYLWVKPGSGGGGGGAAGADGFSPIVTMTAAEDGSGTTLAILDKNGLKTAFISNGTDGADGINGTNGVDGTNGTDGVDGISPTVSMTEVTGGTEVIITDKDGSKKTTIYNGIKGTDGKDGVSITDVDVTADNKLTITLSEGDPITTANSITVDVSKLIDDTKTSSATTTWSTDKIIAYVQKVLEDIENGTY